MCMRARIRRIMELRPSPNCYFPAFFPKQRLRKKKTRSLRTVNSCTDGFWICHCSCGSAHVSEVVCHAPECFFNKAIFGYLAVFTAFGSIWQGTGTFPKITPETSQFNIFENYRSYEQLEVSTSSVMIFSLQDSRIWSFSERVKIFFKKKQQKTLFFHDFTKLEVRIFNVENNFFREIFSYVLSNIISVYDCHRIV